MSLAKLRQARAAAVDKLGLPETIADAKAFETLEAEIIDLDGQIARTEKAQSRAASLARPLDPEVKEEGANVVDFFDGADDEIVERALARLQSRGLPAAQMAYSSEGMAWSRRFDAARTRARRRTGMGAVDRTKEFLSFGEFLRAVAYHYTSHGTSTDSRLVRAPTGAGEVDPTGGGFLVQTDFATAIFMLAHEMGELLSRVNKLPISANANGIKLPAVDETSRATGSRWGGVQSFWMGEGSQPTNTRPSFREIELSLKKLISLFYMTDELLEDTTALTSIASQAFSEEVMFMTEDGIFEGTGAGMPTGIMGHRSTIVVPAETGQATQTIVKPNIDKMWSRMWSRSRMRSIWTINQDCEPQLFELSQVVGTGGKPVYIPPGGLADKPYGSLFGRPVVATEYNNSVGTSGDIALFDLSQYVLIDKGGVKAATSMHVAFLTDQMVFRITYRVDGKPMWTKDLTPFKGTNTKAPFVVLASR